MESPTSAAVRDRVLADGAASLSAAELLRIIIETDEHRFDFDQMARGILTAWGGLHGLARITPAEVGRINGLGEAACARLLACVELARRLSVPGSGERPIITQAKAVIPLIADMGYLAQEQVRVILLDANRRLMAIRTVYIGTVYASVIRVSEVFREAILSNSPAFILAHNHPAGDPTPSPEDFELTRSLIEAGKLLDVQLLDHIIIGQDGWTSMKTQGMVFD